MPGQINLHYRPRNRQVLGCARYSFFAVLFIFTIVCAGKDAFAAPVITSPGAASGKQGSAFSYQITATNSPTSFGATGLPTGLWVNTSTGLISGTPTTAGSSTITLSASNSGGTGVATAILIVTPNSPLVQVSAKAASGTAKSLSLSFTNNTLTGDLILIGFDYDTNSTPLSIVDSQGNSFIAVGNQLTTPGGSRSVVYFARSIKGGADTLTVNLTANSGWIEVYAAEYYGVNQTNPIDAQAGATGNAGPVTSGYGVTTVSGDLIYGYCVGDWTCSAGSGLIARSTFNDNLIEDEIAGPPGSYAAIGSANKGWAMHMVALKPASPVTGAVVSLSPSALTFASQITGTTSPAQTVLLTNTGNTALSISSITLTGANASSFTQVSTCGSTLAANSSCTIVVLFNPSSTGARSAVLTIADNANGGSQSVSLSGGGAHDVVLTWTASPTTTVTGYNVYRGTASGGESSIPLNTTTINGTTFADGNVTAGTKYYYTVKAVTSAGGLSVSSNEAPATVPSP